MYTFPKTKTKRKYVKTTKIRGGKCCWVKNHQTSNSEYDITNESACLTLGLAITYLFIHINGSLHYPYHANQPSTFQYAIIDEICCSLEIWCDIKLWGIMSRNTMIVYSSIIVKSCASIDLRKLFPFCTVHNVCKTFFLEFRYISGDFSKTANVKINCMAIYRTVNEVMISLVFFLRSRQQIAYRHAEFIRLWVCREKRMHIVRTNKVIRQ